METADLSNGFTLGVEIIGIMAHRTCTSLSGMRCLLANIS